MGLFLEDYTPRITFTAHRITMRQIAAEICEAYDMTLDELRGPRVFKTYNEARQEFWWRVRNETRLSYTQIAIYSNRDHSSVHAGVRIHDARVRMAEACGSNSYAQPRSDSSPSRPLAETCGYAG